MLSCWGLGLTLTSTRVTEMLARPMGRRVCAAALFARFSGGLPPPSSRKAPLKMVRHVLHGSLMAPPEERDPAALQRSVAVFGALLHSAPESLDLRALARSFQCVAVLKKVDRWMLQEFEKVVLPMMEHCRTLDLREMLISLAHCVNVGHASDEFVSKWLEVSIERIPEMEHLWYLAESLSMLQIQPGREWMTVFAKRAAEDVHRCPLQLLAPYLSDFANIAMGGTDVALPFVKAWESVAEPHLWQMDADHVTRIVAGAFVRLKRVPPFLFLHTWIDVLMHRLKVMNVREKWALGDRVFHMEFQDRGQLARFARCWCLCVKDEDLGNISEVHLSITLSRLAEISYAAPVNWIVAVGDEWIRRFQNNKVPFKALHNSLISMSLIVDRDFGSVLKPFVSAWAARTAENLHYCDDHRLLGALAAFVRLGMGPEDVGRDWCMSYLTTAGTRRNLNTLQALGSLLPFPHDDASLWQACIDMAASSLSIPYSRLSPRMCVNVLINWCTIGTKDERVFKRWIAESQPKVREFRDKDLFMTYKCFRKMKLTELLPQQFRDACAAGYGRHEQMWEELRKERSELEEIAYSKPLLFAPRGRKLPSLPVTKK